MIAFTMLVLPALGHHWRTPRYLGTVAAAIVVAAPLAALWPLLLSMSGPGNLQQWLAYAMASRWTDPVPHEVLEMFYFARLLPWYAWPAWPLAAWALYRSRRTLRERRDLLLPLGAFIAFFLVASVMGEARDANAMPLLIPLVILGAAELDSLPRARRARSDWFGTMTFLCLAAIIWIGFYAATTGHPAAALAWITREVPDFKYKFSFLSCALAALLTLIWIVVVARSLRSTRRAIVNWAAGITMSWMLMMTLGLPLVEQARSYRDVSARVVLALPQDFHVHRAPEPGRCTARAPGLLREHHHDTRGAAGLHPVQRADRAGLDAQDSRGESRMGGSLARLAPGRPARAFHRLPAPLQARRSSTSSIQCLTGTSDSVAMCARHPMLAVATSAGRPDFSARSFRGAVASIARA
jgi:hypothetical protein